MAPTRTRPRSITVWFRGVPYSLDLVRCRRALVERQIEGRFDSMEGLAQAVGISRSTTSRFFSGRQTSLQVTLKILEALGLTFHDVATPQHDTEDDDGDNPDGGASAGVRARPGPRAPERGTVIELAVAP